MEKNSIKKNVVLNITYNILNIIFPLITFPYVSRVLMVEGLGNVTFFSTMANYAIMLSALGINTYGVRAVSRVRDNKKQLSKVTVELLIINAVASVTVVLLLLISSLYVTKFSSEPILLAINCALIFTSPFGLNFLFYGLEQYRYITKLSILVKTIALILVFLLVKTNDDYCVYAAITAFSTIGAYIFNLLYARKFITFTELKNLEYSPHFNSMMFFFASSLAVSVYISLDTIMLGFISGDEQVGLYAVAVKIKTLLLIVVNAISAVLFPRLSYYIATNRLDDFRNVLKKSFSTILMISIPLTIFFIIESKDSVLFLGGQDYLEASSCMKIIMPILILSGISNITGNQILLPIGKEKCFMKAVIAGAFIDLILNILLMPTWGCIGAAVATLLAECTQLSIQMYYSKVYVIPAIQWKVILHIVFSTFCSSLFLVYIQMKVHYSGLLNILFGSICFFMCYGFILVIMKDDLIFDYLKEFHKLRKRWRR